jgi:hypothetical protein
MAWRTQKEIIRDRDQDRRDRERRDVRDASAYWDGGGCDYEDAEEEERRQEDLCESWDRTQPPTTGDAER